MTEKHFESQAITISGYLTRDAVEGAYQLWGANVKPILREGYWIGGNMIGGAPSARAARIMLGILTQLSPGDIMPVEVDYHIREKGETESDGQ